MSIFQEQKPLRLRELPTQASPFQNLPPESQFTFTVISKMRVPHFRDFGKALPYNCDFLPKIKIVRMFYRNLVYSTEFKICDGTCELGGKIKDKGVEQLKNQL